MGELEELKDKILRGELLKYIEKYRALKAEFDSYKSWHEEFYERIDADSPDVVQIILDDMGKADEEEPT